MHNLDFEASAAEREMYKLVTDIEDVKRDIEVIDAELGDQAAVMSLWGAECDAAAVKKATEEEYGFQATLRHLRQFAKSTRVVAVDVIARGLFITAATTALWTTFNDGLLQHVIGEGQSLQSQVTGIRSITDIIDVGQYGQSAVLATIPMVQTMIQDVKAVKLDGENYIKSAQPTLEYIQSEWKAQEDAVVQRTQMVMSRSQYDQLVDEWIGDLTECSK